MSRVERSALMARVRQKHTAPEIAVRCELHAMGVRFTVNGPKNRTLPGRPDIVLPARKLVVFVHGCFWHRHVGCIRTTTPTANRDFWLSKFAANVSRDALQKKKLRKLGWRPLVVWECETKRPERLKRRLARLLQIDDTARTESAPYRQLTPTKARGSARLSGRAGRARRR
ncbi:MAG: hypothetical protein C0518_00725 [Opitutus sp.]|nr:hypothetical protein [Opitutus sp.]